MWTRCGVSGFVYKMILHHGEAKNGLNQPASIDSPLFRSSRQAATTPTTDNVLSNAQREILRKQFGSSGVVVLEMVRDVPVGTSIFIDNYFSSSKLIQKLTEMEYRVICTLKANRVQKCPISTEKQFQGKPRGYYEHYVSNNNKCTVIAWKDSKRVLLGSNHIGPEPETTVKRWNKEEHRHVDVLAPQIIKQYNQFMGGVDTLDMLVALHPILFRSKRWYTRIIWRIFDLMIINSWIIMKHYRSSDGDEGAATSFGPFRLFYFKPEIAKYLLRTTKVQP